jgi:hypothetical protein
MSGAKFLSSDVDNNSEICRRRDFAPLAQKNESGAGKSAVKGQWRI